MILVTGGAGFIGLNFIVDWLRETGEPVVNLDALTYAGNRRGLAALAGDDRHRFVHGDIGDRALVEALLATHRPRAIVHLAAESHVDRSLGGPAAFVRTNIDGTFVLLEAARAYWSALPAGEREVFRFLHVSTDEVYGSLAPGEPAFSEQSPYAPNSPYSASKAASDHLARAWQRSYGLPVLMVHSSNNYGPWQMPEKLIPLAIGRALAGEPIPLYGDGLHVRDWLHVTDHCAALRAVLAGGRPGERWNVGGGQERANAEVLATLCRLLDALRPDPAGPRERLVTPVADRPGHDRRYAIDAGKLTRELGWRPRLDFETGLAATVRWYLAHEDWLRERVRQIRSGDAT